MFAHHAEGSQYLVVHLGHVSEHLGVGRGGTVPPRIARRKLFVDLADEIEALDARLRSDDPWMAIDDLPVSRFNDLLIEADLIIDGDGWIPEEIPDAQFEQFIKLARKALRETRRA